MRTLAEFIMRGRSQAILVLLLSGALPMLFWLSAAAGSLVLLRRGVLDALSVVMWALLPALLWWYFGDPRVLMVIVGSLLLASVLRRWASWEYALLASVALGLLYGWLLTVSAGDQISTLAAELKKLLPRILGNAYHRLSGEEQKQLGDLVSRMLTGVLAAILQMVVLGCLMLGRYWQALLYNPGGLGKEFAALRLHSPLMLVLVVGMLSPNLAPSLTMLTPVCSVPLAFAGLALIHGLGASKPMLAALYVAALVLFQVVYPVLVVLAILDSLVDFRGRRGSSDGSASGGGEG